MALSHRWQSTVDLQRRLGHEGAVHLARVGEERLLTFQIARSSTSRSRAESASNVESTKSASRSKPTVRGSVDPSTYDVVALLRDVDSSVAEGTRRDTSCFESSCPPPRPGRPRRGGDPGGAAPRSASPKSPFIRMSSRHGEALRKAPAPSWLTATKRAASRQAACLARSLPSARALPLLSRGQWSRPRSRGALLGELHGEVEPNLEKRQPSS